MNLAQLFIDQDMNLKDAFDAIVDGVVVINSQREIIYYNQVAEQLTGITKQAPARQTASYYGLFHEDQKTMLSYEELPSVRAIKGEKISAEMFFIRNARVPEGKFLQYSASPLLKDGAVLGAVITYRDLTEKILSERRREEERFHIENIARLASLGNTMSEIAHEINNPLTILSSICWMMKSELEQGKTEKLMENIQSIEETTKRMQQIAMALKNTSRVVLMNDTEGHVLKDSWHDAITVCMPKIKSAGIKLTLLDPENLQQVWLPSNRILLSQLLINLIMNAADALEDKSDGAISVTLLRKDSTLIYRIEDNGPGVPEEMREKIFDAFFTTKPVGKGTGLGLSISRSLVHKLGGKLELKPEISKSCFELYLPMTNLQF